MCIRDSLCAGQVPAVDPAGAAVQRGTESRCQCLRKGAWLSGGGNGRKNRLKSGRLRKKCRVCTRCFDRQSPQAYSVSTSRLWAQMCGYGAGEKMCIRDSIVSLYRRVFCNPFRFQHGSNRFLVGLFQPYFKGNAAFTKRLAHKDVDVYKRQVFYCTKGGKVIDF